MALYMVYKNKIGSMNVIENKKIGQHHLNSRYTGVVHRSDDIFHTSSRLDIISIGMPLYPRIKKSKSISFASIFAKQPPW
jgi:hypothetical protein